LRRWTFVAFVVAALAAVATFAAGCGAFDMDEMHARMHRPGDLASQTPLLSEAEEVTVEIVEYDFSPRDLTIKVGTQVTWINRDNVPHDATANDAWGTGILKMDEGTSISLDEPGTYNYICTVHPYMTGTLTVKAAQ
jgi:plastocyanin